MMPLGFWELVIIAVIFGLPLLAAGLIVWVIVRGSSRRASPLRPPPLKGKDSAPD